MDFFFRGGNVTTSKIDLELLCKGAPDILIVTRPVSIIGTKHMNMT